MSKKSSFNNQENKQKYLIQYVIGERIAMLGQYKIFLDTSIRLYYRVHVFYCANEKLFASYIQHYG